MGVRTDNPASPSDAQAALLQSPTLRLAMAAIGILLLGAAMWVIWRQHEALQRAMDAARAAPAWLVLATLFLPLGNWLISSTIFYLLTRRLASVGKCEMAALIGSAWLLNMLPFKPGLVGRVAYHKAISGVPIVKSIGVTITAMLSGSVAIVLTVGAQLLLDGDLRASAPPGRLAWVGAGVVLAATLPAGVLLWRRRALGEPLLSGGRAVGAAILLRIADTHLWSLRYLLAFRLIGYDQPYGVCVVIAGVSQIAGQMPVQLGLREWTVGLTSGAIRLGVHPLATAAAAPGLMADLVCRAAEIACAIPVGIVSFLWIRRHLARARA